MLVALDALATIARRALPRMLDEASGLFVHKEMRTPAGIRGHGRSPLYTAMALIGLIADDDVRVTAVVPSLDRSVQALYEHAASSTATALRGTALWALALAGDLRAAALVDALERDQRLVFASSWELGLLLSGLSAVAEEQPAQRDRALRLASDCARELLGRFSPRGQLFRGHGRIARPTAILERNLTSFANQAYPIHGLAAYGSVTGATPAAEALRAAERIVELQGPDGQWWWLYSAVTGGVVERYPVFSVHQDGMAPMALIAIQQGGGGDFGSPLSRSVSWISRNELARPMADAGQAFVARCIQRTGGDPEGRHGVSRGVRTAAVLRSLGRQHDGRHGRRASELEVLLECRPYHLGWILYARALALRAARGA